MNFEEIGKEILKLADIEVDGDRDWDIKVNDKRFYKRYRVHKFLSF